MSILKFLFIISFFYFYTFAYETQLEETSLKKLANNYTWNKLLHYKNKKSEILDKDFFISQNGNLDSQEELKETIEAYFSTTLKKDDSHPRCKFPARYLWLSKQINLPNYAEIPNYCKKLSKWSVYKDTESISVILVSGYLGNPASTFGHSFLKLNSNNQNLENDLFDSSINFGALVPDSEPIIKYIFKGIFGGYEAGFSDKYFYTQDLIYSHTEFRDMWDYKLNINEYERKLLLFYFWEVVGKKFKYYFLNKNCGYRVSDALELISNEPIIDSANAWYAPIETFHKLESISKNTSIISDVKYIPSSQKRLYSRYLLLNSIEQNTINSIIKHNYKNIKFNLKKHSISEKINILDFLIEYEKYLLIKDPKLKDREKIKNKLLLQRLALPIKTPLKAQIKNKKSPAKGNKPIKVGLGLTHLSNIGSYPTLNFSVFAIEALGDNSLEFDELIVGDLSLAYKNELLLNKFDLIKIKKLKKETTPWDNSSSNISWQLNIGSNLIEKDRKKHNDLFVKGAIGKVLFNNDNFISYAFLNSTLHNNYPYVDINPTLNFDINLNEIKTSMSFGVMANPYNQERNETLSLSTQYKIYDDFSIFINYKKEKYDKSSLNLKWFF